MSRMHDQSATPRADRPARRLRRSIALTLTTLEDRRLMTAGVAATTIDPTVALTPSTAATTTLIAPQPTSLTIAGAADAAPTDAWIYSGSESQFGPTAPYVLYGGGNAWPIPSGPSSATDPTSDQAKLDAAFTKQSTDVQTIQDKSEVTPRLLASLRQAREAVAAQAGQPDSALLKTFEDDAQKVRDSGTFTDAQQQQLKNEYTAVLKSAGVSDAAIAGLFAAQDAVKAASHVTPDDVALLAADQQAVQTLMDAMPHDATFAAAGAPTTMMMHPGAGMNRGVSSAAVPISASAAAAGATPAGEAVDANTDPATLAATTSAPVTTKTTPAFDARAAAMGRAPAGATLPGVLTDPVSRSATVVPGYHSSPSNVTPLAGAMKRLASRTMNANVRRGVTVRSAAPGETVALPAVRQRPNFTGAMRRARTV